MVLTEHHVDGEGTMLLITTYQVFSSRLSMSRLGSPQQDLETKKHEHTMDIG